DWYLELAKPFLSGSDSLEKAETQAMVAWARDEILKLLHPFMPFITEELWAVSAHSQRDGLLAQTAWPKLAEFENLISIDDPKMDVVIDVVTETRSIRTIYNIPPKDPLAINLTNFSIANSSILNSSADSISRLANTIVQIDNKPVATPGRATIGTVITSA